MIRLLLNVKVSYSFHLPEIKCSEHTREFADGGQYFYLCLLSLHHATLRTILLVSCHDKSKMKESHRDSFIRPKNAANPHQLY